MTVKIYLDDLTALEEACERVLDRATLAEAAGEEVDDGK